MTAGPAALEEYVHAARAGARRLSRWDPGGSAPLASIDVARARWHRMGATHLARRLGCDRYAEAAAAGLQDSAPRAGMVALHARVASVGREAWQHPDLAQTWFRWADHLVARADLPLFTLGTMPRERRWADALDRLADTVEATLGPGGRAPSRSVSQRLPGLPLRSACSTGRVLIRWDARTVDILAAHPPAADPEIARVDLARRFVHCHGPAAPWQLARWAMLTEADTVDTWRALGPELAAVAVGDERRWVLACDLASLLEAGPPTGARLVPAGDPVLHPADDVVARRPRPVPPQPRPVTSRLVNSLTGRVLVDGRPTGAWGRVRGDVTVLPWAPLGAGTVDAVEAEASSMAAALGFEPRLRWLAAG